MEVVTLALPPICWGVYGQLRMRYSPSIDTISFTAIYVIGQVLFTFAMWICYGLKLEHDLNSWNAAIVFVGGFTVMYAEYLLFAAADRISASTAKASFCLSSAIIGIPLDFIFEKNSHVDGALLFLGTALLLSGLIILIFAEWLIIDTSKVEKCPSAPRSKHSPACSVSGRYEALGASESQAPTHSLQSFSVPRSKQSPAGSIAHGGRHDEPHALPPRDNGAQTDETEPNGHDEQTRASSRSERHEPSVASRAWSRHTSRAPSAASLSRAPSAAAAAAAADNGTDVVVGCALGVLGGVFNTIWSVLAAVAGGNPGPFTSPPTLLLVFDAGQLAALPFVVLIFSYWAPLRPQDPAADDSAGGAWARLLRTPPAEIAWALAVGALVCLGYWGYFASTLPGAGRPAGAPASVVYALVFCDMLVSLYASVFLFAEYGDWRAIAAGGPLWLVLVSGTACYVAGICVLALQIG